jgi:hypothetical protein
VIWPVVIIGWLIVSGILAAFGGNYLVLVGVVGISITFLVLWGPRGLMRRATKSVDDENTLA